MKKQLFLTLILCILFTGCGNKQPVNDVIMETEVIQENSDIIEFNFEETQQVSTNIETELETVTKTDYSLSDYFEFCEKEEQHLLDEVQKAKTQMDMTENARKRFELWDAALNNVWNILMTILAEDEKEALRLEEKEWIEYKDKEIEKIGIETGGGSIQPMLEYDKATEITKERAYELKEILENLPDSTNAELENEISGMFEAFVEESKIPNIVDESMITEPKYVIIDLSTTEETYMEGDSVTPLKLEILSQKDNGVSMADEWYLAQELSLPMKGSSWDCFYDDMYEYQWIGESLYIYEKETGDCLYVLEYPTDKWYVNGPNAYLKDGIFYGGSVMNGYAMPNTCFMFAYDLNNNKLLWRSADQTYNTMNFVVRDNIIICGYGFTAENDYLYQLNMNTGEIIDKIELNKMPDLLIEQDGKLYVHTYSYDYVIGME